MDTITTVEGYEQCSGVIPSLLSGGCYYGEIPLVLGSIFYTAEGNHNYRGDDITNGSGFPTQYQIYSIVLMIPPHSRSIDDSFIHSHYLKLVYTSV